MPLDERCNYVLNYLIPNARKELTPLQYENAINALKIIDASQIGK